MILILLVLSLIAAGVGFFYLSEATLGIGIIGLAALFAIFARIAQAEEQHREIRRLLTGSAQSGAPENRKSFSASSGISPMKKD